MDDLSLTNRPAQLAELVGALLKEWAEFADEQDCWDDTLDRGLDLDEWLAMKLADHVLLRDQLEQLGCVINGVEFVPLEIMRKHMPFVVPEGQTCVAVFRERD